MNDPHHAAHTLPKTLPKILVLAWHKEEWKGCINQFPEPVCGVINVPLATYKKKVSIHWPSYCRSEQKLCSSKSDLNLNIFSFSNLTQSIITFEVKKVTVIYIYMCMISPRSISLPSSIIWFIICADINHGFGSVRGQHGANPGLWLVNKGDRMCLHLMGLGSPSKGEERSSGIPNCFSLQRGLWTFAVGPLAHKLTLQKFTINHDWPTLSFH